MRPFGRQCLVKCHLNNHQVQALWDTGPQVSIIDERWKEEKLMFQRSLNDLTLTAANGTEMHYLGWFEII